MPAAGGVMVEFRHNDTGELLWKARMQSFPAKDNIVGWALTGGEMVWFEVQRVKFEFRQPTSLGEGSIPSTTNCQHYPIVYVTEE